MTNEEIEKNMAELEKMRANKGGMSKDEVVAWITAHPGIVAECCDCSIDDVKANPANYVDSMLNDL